VQRDCVSPLACEFLRRGKRRDAAAAAAMDFEVAHNELEDFGQALKWLADALTAAAAASDGAAAAAATSPAERAHGLLVASLEGLQKRFNSLLRASDKGKV
jgi:hypothetical protein